MNPDKRMVNRLLSMSDQQLEELIRTVANEVGVSPSDLGLEPERVRELRAALEAADEEALEKVSEAYALYRQSNRKK